MFLGIDIGTSAVKIVVVDDKGGVVEKSSAPLNIQRPGDLMSEQIPEDWWSAVNQAVRDISSESRKAILAIGLSGQMHGAVLLDSSGMVIRPAVLWNDGRSIAECEELQKSLPELGEITGNLAMPGFTAPKLLWLKRHEPQSYARIAKVVLPKDYIRYRMTGELATDMSDAAGTLWLDTKNRCWSSKVLDVCGLTEGHMPLLYEGNQVSGMLHADIAKSWEMGVIPVAAGAGDNAAGAVGSGIVAKGDAFLSLGTSGVIFLADDSYRSNPSEGVHTFCHALPGRWHQMSVMLSAASAVDQVASILGYDRPSKLYEVAAHYGTPCQKEIFLPYMTGERTPHNNTKASGVFFGLSPLTEPEALAQAALEGVAFGLADGLEALKSAGNSPESLSVIGGGAQSEYWGVIISSILNHPLVYRDGGEVGPAFGAARLARLAIGDEAIEDVCVAPPILKVIEPDEKLCSHYTKRQFLFRKLYTSLVPCFEELN
ncbi:MAG: xylulokinase [Methyloligellaceae bacterium]